MSDSGRNPLDAPVTRGELIDLIQGMHDALVAQARFTAALIDLPEGEQRRLGQAAIEASTELLNIAERMLASMSRKH